MLDMSDLERRIALALVCRYLVDEDTSGIKNIAKWPV